MRSSEEIKAGLRCHAIQRHSGECPDHVPGCKGCPYDNDYHDPDELMADALTMIEELEVKAPNWISVKERPPESRQEVLFVPVGQRKVKAGTYIGEGKCGGHWFRAYNAPTTAHWWMPQPELPKEEE